MTLHIQKNNKVFSLLLPFVLACCLLCVSFPAASAASSDEGLTDGRFRLGSSPMNLNIERLFYSGSDHCYLRFGQIGDFSDGSSFSPFLSSGYFVSSGDGFVTVSYPAFDVTTSRSGGPTLTSAPTLLSFRVSSVENGNTTGADYPVTGSSYQVGSDSSTSTACTKPGSFSFPVTKGGRYSVSFCPLFQFDANSEVGSFLVVQSFSPITFTTSSNDVKLRPYNSGSRPVVGLDVASYPVTVIAPEGCTVNPLEGYSFHFKAISIALCSESCP